MSAANGAHAVEVAGHFDAAHRLPHMPGKCQSLHGHTWHYWVRFIRADGGVDVWDTVCDFGYLKDELRANIDTLLDHGTMLGDADPLAPLLEDAGTKVYRFIPAEPEGPGRWPTVESVAALIGQWATRIAARASEEGLYAVEVRIQETVSNTAVWTPSVEVAG